MFDNVVGLSAICLSQHLVISDISQLKGLSIGVTILDWEGARFDEMLSKGSHHPRVFAPSDIQCQEQRCGGVEEYVLGSVDRNAVEAAVQIVLRAAHRLTGTV